jgi:hypothetical protein
MIEYLLTFVSGGVIFTGILYFALKNNQKYLDIIFNIDDLSLVELEQLKMRINNKIKSVR